MLAILIHQVFAWDHDKFLARCCVSVNLPASISVLASNGVHIIVPPHVTGSEQEQSQAVMRSWMRANAVVERSLPPRLEVPLDLLLLIAGAALARPFSEIFGQLIPGTEATFTWPQVLVLFAAMTIVGVLVTSRGGPRHLWGEIERRIQQSPATFFANLPTGNRRFSKILRQEAERATAICCGEATSLRAMAAVSGMTPFDQPGEKLTANFSITFKFWQVGAGLALGLLVQS